MIAEADNVCASCGRWASRSTAMGSDTSTAISNLLLVTGNYMRPGTGAYPLRGHNNVQGASDHGSMPNTCRAINRSNDPEVRARVRSGLGREAADAPRDWTTTKWSTRSTRASSRSMYLIGEEMSLVDSNAELCCETPSRSSSSSSCRTFSSATRADLPTWCCPPPRAWKKKARSPAPSGAFSGFIRCSSRWAGAGPIGGSSATWPTARARIGTTSIHRRSWTKMAAVTPMFAGVTYERLEGYKSLQWPVAADGTDQPLLYTKEFAFPGRQGAAVSARLDRADRTARRRIRPAPEQRPAARTFPRREPDVPRGRHSREDAGHVCRGLARTGRRARHRRRNVGSN